MMLLLRNAAQLLTLEGSDPARAGKAMGDLGIHTGASVLVGDDGTITWVGADEKTPATATAVDLDDVPGGGRRSSTVIRTSCGAAIGRTRWSSGSAGRTTRRSSRRVAAS